MRNAHMPAFPRDEAKSASMTLADDALGITKREYMAALAMQGLLASDADGTLAMDANVGLSVEYADALLAELERTK